MSKFNRPQPEESDSEDDRRVRPDWKKFERSFLKYEVRFMQVRRAMSTLKEKLAKVDKLPKNNTARLFYYKYEKLDRMERILTAISQLILRLHIENSGYSEMVEEMPTGADLLVFHWERLERSVALLEILLERLDTIMEYLDDYCDVKYSY